MLTSRSHNALSTFSSKSVPRTLLSSSGWCSDTEPAPAVVLSRHLRFVVLCGESRLERGGEVVLVGVGGTPGWTSRESRDCNVCAEVGMV